MHDIFISYSTREREQACAIRAYLRDNGISCWMAPESIPTGSNYTKEIPVAIRGCKIFLLILSENSQKSPWVLRELDSAVNNKKYILPYLLDDSPMEDEFQFLLTGCQWHLSWQENALESLLERIKALLPPPPEPEPVPAPVPAPAPEPEVIPEPAAPQPVAAPPVTMSPSTPGTFVCPACRSKNTEPLKQHRHSCSAGESARYALAWLAGIAAFLPISYVLELLLENVDFLVEVHYAYIVSTFTDLGYAIIYLLSLAGSVGVGFLCCRPIRKWIHTSRMKKHYRAQGMRCRDCCRKFRVSIPAASRFAWETPAAPAVSLPGVVSVRCPACGADGIIPRKNGEGSWDKKETWYFFPAWVVGFLSIFPLIPLVDKVLSWIPFFVLFRNGSFVELSSLGVLVGILLTLAAAYGIVRLVRIPLREPIRRRRVRNHVRACGFRCPECGMDFRMTIPMTHKFSHETTETNPGIRQGK